MKLILKSSTEMKIKQICPELNDYYSFLTEAPNESVNINHSMIYVHFLYSIVTYLDKLIIPLYMNKMPNGHSFVHD